MPSEHQRTNKVEQVPCMQVERASHDEATISAIKQIADAHREELGFHARQTFVESIAKGELFVAKIEGHVCGFVRFHHRRDMATTLYEIAIENIHRGVGVGRELVNRLREDCERVGSRRIKLSCPVELPANNFYRELGFRRAAQRSRAGRSRPLYEWEFAVRPVRPLTFVASLTASAHDLDLMIRMWEAEGDKASPFARCIITPLFSEPRSFEFVRYMHEQWKVEVMFDSGGFFVQQEKIKYDDLFARLLEFYEQHDWAQVYVLPDYVPTSRQTSSEVDERVYVTAAEGVKFLKRMPIDLRARALGVLQGHTPQHLAHCLEAFAGCGMKRIGFGSFDTTGTNAEINILTGDSAKRLMFVREWLDSAFQQNQLEQLPDLHLFGISSPNDVRTYSGYLATSFDSSGWMRTAGFGNVYLPFQGRRNVTHGGSSLLSGVGLTAAEFYVECERTKHECVFCRDFKRLQRDRFARMWHNAIVFDEMTTEINRKLCENRRTGSERLH